jgi:transcriptional regulator with XRE-family HTH domain
MDYPAILLVMDETFGAFLKRKRAALRMTQREMAEHLDVTQAYVSQLESGKVTLPGADLRRRIARGLGVSHIDVLVAAGEITREEAGPSAPPPFPEGDERAVIVEMLRKMPDDDVHLAAMLVRSVATHAQEDRESLLTYQAPTDSNES